MSIRRTLVATLAAAAALLLSAGPALAQTGIADRSSYVVLTGRLDVPEGATYDTAVIFDGPMTIEGSVTGDAVAFNGDIIVRGTVDGNVTSLNGRVTVTAAGHVGGDVVSSEAPLVAPGSVAGTVRQGTDFNVGWSVAFGRFLWWLITTGSVFVLGLLLTLLLPRAADAVAEAALRRAGASAGWGAAAFFGLPILAVVAMLTVVAGLAGFSLLLALVLVYLVGYTAGALALGRALLKPPRARFVAFLAGFAILRAAALVPVLGGLLFVLAAGWGIGACVVAAFRAGRGRSAAGVASPPNATPPVPPMPAMP